MILDSTKTSAGQSQWTRCSQGDEDKDNDYLCLPASDQSVPCEHLWSGLSYTRHLLILLQVGIYSPNICATLVKQRVSKIRSWAKKIIWICKSFQFVSVLEMEIMHIISIYMALLAHFYAQKVSNHRYLPAQKKLLFESLLHLSTAHIIALFTIVISLWYALLPHGPSSF